MQFFMADRMTSQPSGHCYRNGRLSPATARRLGFEWAETAQEALDLAFKVKGKHAKVVVLQQGGEVMPVIGP